MTQKIYPTVTITDLEEYGVDRDRFLSFLYALEKRGLLKSSLEPNLDGKRTERVWRGYQISPTNPKEAEG